MCLYVIFIQKFVSDDDDDDDTKTVEKNVHFVLKLQIQTRVSCNFKIRSEKTKARNGPHTLICLLEGRERIIFYYFCIYRIYFFVIIYRKKTANIS